MKQRTNKINRCIWLSTVREGLSPKSWELQTPTNWPCAHPPPNLGIATYANGLAVVNLQETQVGLLTSTIVTRSTSAIFLNCNL